MSSIPAATFTHTIPVSTAIAALPASLSGRTLKRIYTDVNMEGAALRFYQSDDDSAGSYQLTRDSENNVVEITFTKGDLIELLPGFLLGVQYIKVQTTDGAGTPVNQTGAAATLKLIGATL